MYGDLFARAFGFPVGLLRSGPCLNVRDPARVSHRQSRMIGTRLAAVSGQSGTDVRCSGPCEPHKKSVAPACDHEPQDVRIEDAKNASH